MTYEERRSAYMALGAVIDYIDHVQHLTREGLIYEALCWDVADLGLCEDRKQRAANVHALLKEIEGSRATKWRSHDWEAMTQEPQHIAWERRKEMIRDAQAAVKGESDEGIPAKANVDVGEDAESDV